jgi:hypothetical protein
MSAAVCAVDGDVVTVYQAVGREVLDRCAQVRALHDVIDVGGGLLICEECCRGGVRVIWPCPTLQLLDDMPAP